jgi:hypothetical protein
MGTTTTRESYSLHVRKLRRKQTQECTLQFIFDKFYLLGVLTTRLENAETFTCTIT